ncbi:uncharacterized protein ISCGN_021824 [Ixodes scapularis]
MIIIERNVNKVAFFGVALILLSTALFIASSAAEVLSADARSNFASPPDSAAVDEEDTFDHDHFEDPKKMRVILGDTSGWVNPHDKMGSPQRRQQAKQQFLNRQRQRQKQLADPSLRESDPISEDTASSETRVKLYSQPRSAANGRTFSRLPTRLDDDDDDDPGVKEEPVAEEAAAPTAAAASKSCDCDCKSLNRDFKRCDEQVRVLRLNQVVADDGAGRGRECVYLCRQRAELERQVEEWKVELKEHKKKCEEMVQQLTGVVNKRKEEVAEKTAVGAADRCDGVLDCAGKEPAQLYSAAVQQGSRKAAEVEAEKAHIAGGDEDRQSGVKRVLVVGDSNITRVKEGLLGRVKGDGRGHCLWEYHVRGETLYREAGSHSRGMLLVERNETPVTQQLLNRQRQREKQLADPSPRESHPISEDTASSETWAKLCSQLRNRSKANGCTFCRLPTRLDNDDSGVKEEPVVVPTAAVQTAAAPTAAAASKSCDCDCKSLSRDLQSLFIAVASLEELAQQTETQSAQLEQRLSAMLASSIVTPINLLAGSAADALLGCLARLWASLVGPAQPAWVIPGLATLAALVLALATLAVLVLALVGLAVLALVRLRGASWKAWVGSSLLCFFLLSFVWHWVCTLKLETARRDAFLSRNIVPPEECSPGYSPGWLRRLTSDDQVVCDRYYEKLLVDPVWQVSKARFEGARRAFCPRRPRHLERVLDRHVGRVPQKRFLDSLSMTS